MLYSQLALLEYTGHHFYLPDPHSSSVQVILERRWDGEEGNESWENTGILGIVSPLLTEQQSAAGPQQSGPVWAPWGGQAAGTFSLGGAQISTTRATQRPSWQGRPAAVCSQLRTCLSAACHRGRLCAGWRGHGDGVSWEGEPWQGEQFYCFLLKIEEILKGGGREGGKYRIPFCGSCSFPQCLISHQVDFYPPLNVS